MSTPSHFMYAHVRVRRFMCMLALGVLAITSQAAAQSSIYASGQYIAQLTQKLVVVRVETETAEQLTLTVEPGKHHIADGAPLAGMHTLRVDGLDAKTTYHYSVASNRGGKEDGIFTTAPADEDRGDVRFALYGDDRGGIATHAVLAKRVVDEPIDFVVNTGDLVADGRVGSQWESFFSIEAKVVRDHCLFTAIGNHELVQENGASFLRYFGTEEQQQKHVFYNTFRWGFVRFFVLNGEGSFLGDDRTWFEHELQKADDEPNLQWRIVVIHSGPFASGIHGDNDKLHSAEIPKMMRQHHVDFVLSGHDHIYERGASDGLRYVVSGGAGAPLYPIKRPRATSRKLESSFHYVIFEIGPDKGKLIAKHLDGSIIEEVGFTKSNMWNDDGPTIAPQSSVASLSTKPPADPTQTLPPDDEDEDKKPTGRGAYVVVGLVVVAAASLYVNQRRMARRAKRSKKKKRPAAPKDGDGDEE